MRKRGYELRDEIWISYFPLDHGEYRVCCIEKNTPCNFNRGTQNREDIAKYLGEFFEEKTEKRIEKIKYTLGFSNSALLNFSKKEQEGLQRIVEEWNKRDKKET